MLIKGEVMKKSQIMRPVLGMLLAALLLTGCDWVKRQLGMPTSEDLAKLKMEMEQKELRERQIKDSIEAARLASLRLAQEKEIPYYSIFIVIADKQKSLSKEKEDKVECKKVW